MKNFKDKIIVKSSTDSLSVVRDFTKKSAEKSGFSPDAVGKIVLAVDEACTNIIKHAYGYNEKGEINIVTELYNGVFSIILTDTGGHFDANKVPDPDIKKYHKQRKAGGLGMFLMKKLMDNVEYKQLPDDTNQLIMTKALN